jgi:hypothetical protein
MSQFIGHRRISRVKLERMAEKTEQIRRVLDFSRPRLSAASETADTLPWAIASTNTTTPTLTTGDGYFVTHHDTGTRMDKLTGVSPTITGTGVLVAELTIDRSTEAGTWATAWLFITDAGITTLATAYSAMTAAGQSDGTHLRVPVWFVARAGGAAPYSLTTTRMWFGHVENTMWRPPF